MQMWIEMSRTVIGGYISQN